MQHSFLFRAEGALGVRQLGDYLSTKLQTETETEGSGVSGPGRMETAHS